MENYSNIHIDRKFKKKFLFLTFIFCTLPFFNFEKWFSRCVLQLFFERRDMNIYVGNLAYKMSEEELRSAFATYGTVDSARFVIDRETGRSKGFGFVEMPNNEEAMAAIEALNGTELCGRTVTVNEARPREEKPRGFRK